MDSNRKTKIPLLALVMALILCMCSCNSSINSMNRMSEVLDEQSNTLLQDADNQVQTQEIYDAFGESQGYIEIYNNYIKYINKGLGYSFELPKSWEGNFIVDIDYDTKFISVRFFGESKEGKGPYWNDAYLGLNLFEIIYEVDFEYLMYENVYYLGAVEGINLYHIAPPDCEICALYDEIELYEEGISDYQNNEDEIVLLQKDLETVERMRSNFDYTGLNFKVIN